MRAEMARLRKCFDEALSGLGGLDSLAEGDSAAKAAAINDKLPE